MFQTRHTLCKCVYWSGSLGAVFFVGELLLVRTLTFFMTFFITFHDLFTDTTTYIKTLKERGKNKGMIGFLQVSWCMSFTMKPSKICPVSYETWHKSHQVTTVFDQASAFRSYWKGHACITVRRVMIFTSLDENAPWGVCGPYSRSRAN